MTELESLQKQVQRMVDEKRKMDVYVKKMELELKIANAIIGRLDKTKDGVPVMSGMDIYFIAPPYNEICSHRVDGRKNQTWKTCIAGYEQCHYIHTSYSTEELAKKANAILLKHDPGCRFRLDCNDDFDHSRGCNCSFRESEKAENKND